MENYTFTENSLIRYKIVKDYDPIFGGEYWDYQFEIFKRPYFFGLLGKKKWEVSVTTNSFDAGYSFSLHLLKKSTYNKNLKPNSHERIPRI